MIPLRDQLAAMREILARCSRSYPVAVRNGNMTQAESDRRLALQWAICQTLERCAALEEISAEMIQGE